MQRNTSVRLGAAALFLALVVFVLIAWIMANAWPNGVVLLFYAMPLFLALLSAAAFLSYGKSRLLHRSAWSFLVFLALFYAGAVGNTLPYLRSFTRGIVNAVPHHRRIEQEAPEGFLAGLLLQGLKAQDGETIDLRGLNVRGLAWTRLCIFASGTTDRDAHALANLDFSWEYRDGRKNAVMLLATPGEIAASDEIPESVARFPKSFCVPRESAVLHRLAPGTPARPGPTLGL